MLKLQKILALLLSLFSVNSSLATESHADVKSLQKCMVLTLKDGDVLIKLEPSVAPNHVARIIELTNQGFYNGLKFHRVIDGFMAQTGDPKGDGTGGSGKNIKAEFNKEKHMRGTVSMARAASPDSADSQFFIVYAAAPYLDGQYTVFGKVAKGMEFVDMIKKGDSNNNGAVAEPADKIIAAKIIDSEECQNLVSQ